MSDRVLEDGVFKGSRRFDQDPPRTEHSSRGENSTKVFEDTHKQESKTQEPQNPSFQNLLSQDERKDLALRPLSLKEFEGQKTAKRNLAVFIGASLKRQESLDHTFFSGPPGLGKTTLASVLANELGADFKATSAPMLDKPKDLVGLLTNLVENSVFFIDEIHRLKPALEEILYIAMEDFGIDWIIGQGPAARTIRIPLPRFTLVGATTKPGHITAPLYGRFGIHLVLEYYDESELKNIILRSAKLLDLSITESAATLLASSSRGTPRVANRLLRRIRDFGDVYNQGHIDREILVKSLSELGIDSFGLERKDKEILSALIDKYQGGPVGLDTLAIAISEHPDSLEDFYEPYLIQRGYLKRTPRGRTATPLAYEYLGVQAPRSRESVHAQEKLPFED